MFIKRFEDIIAWQRGRDLTKIIYKLFKTCNDFGFRNQLERAVVSIMNNIAEGFERGGKNEFKYFLFIAKASCAECRSMLYVALDLEYITKKDFDQLYNLTLEISHITGNLIKSLN